jgi:hypothetical protein
MQDWILIYVFVIPCVISIYIMIIIVGMQFELFCQKRKSLDSSSSFASNVWWTGPPIGQGPSGPADGKGYIFKLYINSENARPADS